MKKFSQFLSGGVNHPKKDSQGEDVFIHSPHTHTGPDTWTDSKAQATATPHGHSVPDSLHGVPFRSWSHSGHWNDVEGQGHFSEPPEGRMRSSGVIIREPDGRHWTISPTNGFGGYKTGIGPKGMVDKGLNARANAIKETHEETGLKVKLTGHAFDVPKTTGITRYYYGERTGGHPKDMGWETQAVHLVSRETLESHLNHPIDKMIARKINGTP